MNRWSVRVRLTVLIGAVALVLGVAAATVGVALLEDQLIAAAVDAGGDEQLAVVQELLLFAEQAEDLGGGVGDVAFADDFVLEDEVDAVVFALLDLDAADALEPLRDVAAVDADGTLAILTNFGDALIVGDGDLELVEPDDLDGLTPILAQPVLEEYTFLATDLDFADIFGEIVSGDVTTRSSAVLDDLSFSTRRLDGRDYVVFADVGDVRSASDRLASIVWIVVPFVAVLAAALAWLLTGRALSPVHAITHRVGEISSGTLHERVPEPPGGDEIAELATTMNAMLDRLERDDLRLRRFVSDASHELRSPVAVLRSEAEVAARDPDATSVADLADGVLAESTRLQGIVEDLLMLARGEERQTTGGVEIDVDDVVLAEAARRRRVPVVTTAVGAGRVTGSPGAVARVITHLLDNAARHAESVVHIGLSTAEATVQLWVDDDGSGIPDSERERIFERFTRLDDARTRDRGGAGLGLAVVAETVRGMGGTVVAEASPVGGARFVVCWPASVPAFDPTSPIASGDDR